MYCYRKEIEEIEKKRRRGEERHQTREDRERKKEREREGEGVGMERERGGIEREGERQNVFICVEGHLNGSVTGI